MPTLILLVISASAPTCKLKESLSLTSTLPCVISNVPSPLFLTVAALSVPIELAASSSSAILLYASFNVMESSSVVPDTPIAV